MKRANTPKHTPLRPLAVLLSSALLCLSLSGCFVALPVEGPEEPIPPRETQGTETESNIHIQTGVPDTDTGSSILTDPEKTSPETEAPLTPEEALVELAAEALWAGRDLPAKGYFKVSIHPHASDGSNRVRFTLHIGGYRTDEYYNVRVSADGEVTEIDGGYHSYRQFIKGATSERIAAAEAGLDRQIARYGDKHSGYYFTVDDEGYLCLTCEVIVDKAFGDHEHKFFTERICKPE